MGETKQLINGKVYGWSSVSILAKEFENIEVTEISYDDEQDQELVYGKKGKLRGYGTGTKKNSVKITMLREDYDEICEVLKKKGVKNFYSYFWPAIIVSFADEGKKTHTDVLSKFVPSKRTFKAAEGDKKLAVELSGIAMGGITTDDLEA